MTEQYRDGSDDDFFSYLITAHCNEKNFFFYSPFPIPIFQYYCSLKKRKKEKKKDTFPNLLNPIQPSPIRSPNIII